MANNNRYRGSSYSNYGNREEDQERYSRKDYNQNDEYGNTYDEDRRREYGSTGSYSGNENNRRYRRYDEDWDDYNNRMGNYGNRSQGNYGSSYGSSKYNRENDYERYGSGSNYGSGSGYGSGYSGSSSYGGNYGNSGSGSGNYGSGNYGYGQQYRNKGYDEDYNEEYGTGSYGYGNRYNRDRDYNNPYNRNNRNRDWWDKTKDEVSSWFGDEDAEKRRRMDKRMGAHRGRGPKGYSRSDERIREDINDRLSDDSFLDATEIDVTVSNGEVTLTGTVDNRIDKRRAEDLAEDISGVKNVQNQLRVKQTTGVNALKNEYQG